VYVCNCFAVTEDQVKLHVEQGACTPRQIASACGAGTDCGSCVRRIQALLGRASHCGIVLDEVAQSVMQPNSGDATLASV
jgi:bacterioferritin-associated ferredoxin